MVTAAVARVVATWAAAVRATGEQGRVARSAAAARRAAAAAEAARKRGLREVRLGAVTMAVAEGTATARSAAAVTAAG